MKQIVMTAQQRLKVCNGLATACRLLSETGVEMPAKDGEAIRAALEAVWPRDIPSPVALTAVAERKQPASGLLARLGFGQKAAAPAVQE